MAGLGTALACARDGHHVTILERDDDADAGDARTRHSSGSGAVHRRCGTRTRSSPGCATCCATARPTCSTRCSRPARPRSRSPRTSRRRSPTARRVRATRIWSPSRAGAPRSNGCCGARCSREPGVELRDGVARGRGSTSSPATRPASRVWAASRPISSSTRAARARRRTRGWPRSARDRCRRSCTRAASSTSRASTGCVGAADARPAASTAAVDLGYLKYAVFLGDNDTFSITYAVDPHDEELRRALAARARVRGGGPCAGRDRAVAGDGCRRADHRRARDGRVAQPLPPARRRRRAARTRLPRGRRRVGVHEPALRTRVLRWRSCTRSGSPTPCANTATITTRWRARSPASPSASWCRGSAPRCSRTRRRACKPRARSCRPRIRARSCRASSATACCPRCAPHRSCSARSCAGSTS